jgi:hypothetical protein
MIGRHVQQSSVRHHPEVGEEGLATDIDEQTNAPCSVTASVSSTRSALRPDTSVGTAVTERSSDPSGNSVSPCVVGARRACCISPSLCWKTRREPRRPHPNRTPAMCLKWTRQRCSFWPRPGQMGCAATSRLGAVNATPAVRPRLPWCLRASHYHQRATGLVTTEHDGSDIRSSSRRWSDGPPRHRMQALRRRSAVHAGRGGVGLGYRSASVDLNQDFA